MATPHHTVCCRKKKKSRTKPPTAEKIKRERRALKKIPGHRTSGASHAHDHVDGRHHADPEPNRRRDRQQKASPQSSPLPVIRRSPHRTRILSSPVKRLKANKHQLSRVLNLKTAPPPLTQPSAVPVYTKHPKLTAQNRCSRRTPTRHYSTKLHAHDMTAGRRSVTQRIGGKQGDRCAPVWPTALPGGNAQRARENSIKDKTAEQGNNPPPPDTRLLCPWTYKPEKQLDSGRLGTHLNNTTTQKNHVQDMARRRRRHRGMGGKSS